MGLNMNTSERVSIHNIVVRFLTKKEDADKISKITGMKVYQHGGINRYVLSDAINTEHPEIHDAFGLIFSDESQKQNIDSKNWVSDFVKDLIEI